MLCPVISMPAFAAGVDHTVEPLVLDGVELDTFHDVCPAEIFNVTSRCPVLAVPAGRSADDVPIGVEIVGRPFDDATVFGIGAAIERRTAVAARLRRPCAQSRGRQQPLKRRAV